MVFHADGVRADWLQDLEADAVAWMAEEGCPGMAIAIVKNDVPIYTKGFGHLKVMTLPSRSMKTRSLLSVPPARLFAPPRWPSWQTRSCLTGTIRSVKLMPSFQMYDPWVNAQFQVEDLLCHRSGLYMFSLTMMEVLDYPTSARVAGIRFQRPYTSFRSTFAYQNCMYTAAAKLVEARTGQSWGKNLHDSIFKPLGMTRSVTTQDAVNQMDNVAIGHLHLNERQALAHSSELVLEFHPGPGAGRCGRSHYSP